MEEAFSISGVSICNYNRIEENKSINVQKGKFSLKKNNNLFSSKGLIAYPGLINSHDHLLGSYFPKVGHGPYLNWKPWDDDLKKSLLYSERENLSTNELYEIGNYRQILSGTTTVCDHIPHNVNEKQIERAWVRIIEQYCLAHEISSYELKWGRNHEIEIEEAKEKNIPFITHIEEGFDGESLRGVEILDSKGGVFENSVLVHCIGCSPEDISLIAKKKASIVWCPNSNMFMFNKTADLKEILNQEINICLGTDSPMSGGINLFDELRCAKAIFKKKYFVDIEDSFLMRMITYNPAKAFKLENQIGQIKDGFLADFILIEKNQKYENYYQSLVQADVKDLEMVFKEGIPLFFKEKYRDFLNLKNLDKNYQKVKINSNNKLEKVVGYLIGNPLKLVKSLKEKIGFEKNLPFFNLQESF